MGVDMVIVARGGMTGVNFKEANEVFGTLIKYMEHWEWTYQIFLSFWRGPIRDIFLY